MESGIVSVIIQGGAVGLAAVTLWILYKIITQLLPELKAISSNMAVHTELLRGLKESIDGNRCNHA